MAQAVPKSEAGGGNPPPKVPAKRKAVVGGHVTESVERGHGQALPSGPNAGKTAYLPTTTRRVTTPQAYQGVERGHGQALPTGPNAGQTAYLPTNQRASSSPTYYYAPQRYVAYTAPYAPVPRTDSSTYVVQSSVGTPSLYPSSRYTQLLNNFSYWLNDFLGFKEDPDSRERRIREQVFGDPNSVGQGGEIGTNLAQVYASHLDYDNPATGRGKDKKPKARQSVQRPQLPRGKYSDEQIKNAQTIIDVGRKRGFSDKDILAGLEAGIVESRLKNVDYGDRDSLGLFQQRSGWGSVKSRLNPTDSTNRFYSALAKLHNRGSSSAAELAQGVQRSAFPGRYGQHGSEARQLLAALGAKAGPETTRSPSPGGTKTTIPTPSPVPKRTTAKTEGPSYAPSVNPTPAAPPMYSSPTTKRAGPKSSVQAPPKPATTPKAPAGGPNTGTAKPIGGGGGAGGGAAPVDLDTSGATDNAGTDTETQPDAASSGIGNAANTTTSTGGEADTGQSTLAAMRAGEGGILGVTNLETVTDTTTDQGETVTGKRSIFVYVLVAAAVAGVGIYIYRGRGGPSGGGEGVKDAFNRFTEAAGNVVQRKAA